MATENFTLKGEPLYGGKGKSSDLTSNHCDTVSLVTVHAGDQPMIGNEPNIALTNPIDVEGYAGLAQPPLHATQTVVLGEDKVQMHCKNKQCQQALQAEQPVISPWTQYQGMIKSSTPTDHSACPPHRNSMCPNGRVLHHPAAKLLKDWATFGCPTKTDKPWSKSEICKAIEWGPHRSALSPDAIAHFAAEADEKVRTNQARLVLWDTIKDDPPKELKISPITAIPHKLKALCSILDLLFCLRLTNGGVRSAVNDTTEITAPAGAINQIGKCLACIIHAFAEADEDAKIFMAKWDIKDGFWRMDCAAGEEWSFMYVLPQEEGKPITLMVPTSVQMGWVKSPRYFCAAMETARDISTDYIEMEINSLPLHKFEHYFMRASEFATLPMTAHDKQGCFLCMVEVYVDDFVSLVIPISQEQLCHVGNAVMHGIHNVFPPDAIDSDDPILEKKLGKGKGTYETRKTLLGFDFDGNEKTMWLESAKCEKLLTVLKGWIRTGKTGSAGIAFGKFESTISKIRHAFTSILAGRGLLSPCNRLLKQRPAYVYLHRNLSILTALKGCRTLLCESTSEPTRCRELVTGWPDYIGIVDASGHSAGGVVFGEQSAYTLVVFHWEWPKDIKRDINSVLNLAGRITNSDLEMAGLVLLWIIIEGVCPDLREKRVTLFSDNSPTVSWVTCFASRRSVVAEHLVQVLALCLKTMHACPLTPLHIEGVQNAIADVPSQSFGSNLAWTCKSDSELLTLFNTCFPFPSKQSWTVYRLNCAVVMRMILALWMQPFVLDDWR